MEVIESRNDPKQVKIIYLTCDAGSVSDYSSLSARVVALPTRHRSETRIET